MILSSPRRFKKVVGKLSTEERCIRHLEQIRWPNGLRCPRCDSTRIATFLASGKHGKERHLYECRDCRYQYSVTTGTIFHRSHVALIKWFLAIYLICSSKNGVAATQLRRLLDLGSYKTAWYMVQRIRLAIQKDDGFCERLLLRG